MKVFVLFFFAFGVNAEVLQTGLTCSTGIDEISSTIGPTEDCCINDDCGNNKRVSKFARRYGIGINDNEDAVTNEDNYVEPCCIDDYDCIREFLANNSKCKPAYGPVPDPLYLSQTTVYFAFANMTLTYSNYTTTGLSDAKITRFRYNKVTNDLVMVIHVPVLTVRVPQFFFTYTRPGQESITKCDVAYTAFKSLDFTAIISNLGERLDLADITHGASDEGHPDYFIGPNAYTSEDPFVKAEYEEFAANIPLAVRCVFLFHSQLLAAEYIQKYICDYGLDLYSV